MKPSTLEELFTSQLGESFEMSGSTTWDQIDAKRELKPKRAARWSTSRKAKIIAIAIVATGICAAALHHYVQPSAAIITAKGKTVLPVHGEKYNSTAIISPIDSPIVANQTDVKHAQSANKTITKQVAPKDAETNIQIADTAVAISSFLPAKLHVDTAKQGINVDSVLGKPKPVKTVVVVQKQQVIVKDTTVTTVKKRLRRRL